jgi:hypothetical protein
MGLQHRQENGQLIYLGPNFYVNALTDWLRFTYTTTKASALQLLHPDWSNRLANAAEGHIVHHVSAPAVTQAI